ncbi:DUF6271 family protein, partial [Kitasatospora sp. NPDC091257]|uniref:DUF6271 family protein n=1 Tax=Kitasatospora sp. NPDC091257 TaxID=3364084 RepID=UPI0037F7B54E
TNRACADTITAIGAEAAHAVRRFGVRVGSGHRASGAGGGPGRPGVVGAARRTRARVPAWVCR